MDEHKTCATCAAFYQPRNADGSPSSIGQCRRRAPTLSDAEDYFPPVGHHMWCLEYLAWDIAVGAA